MDTYTDKYRVGESAVCNYDTKAINKIGTHQTTQSDGGSAG